MFNCIKVSTDLDVAYHQMIKYYMYLYRHLNNKDLHPDAVMQRVFDKVWQELSYN